MMEAFGLSNENEPPGIFRVSPEKEDSFLRNARLLNAEFNLMTPERARRNAGPFAGADKCYEVWGEIRFPEPQVLSQCQERAGDTSGLLQIHEDRRPVILEVDEGNERGYRISVPVGDNRREQIRPANTFLATGIRLPEMLSALNVTHELRVFGTPLLCVRGDPWIYPNGLFHHYMGAKGLTILSHQTPSPERTCNVVGARICSEVPDVNARFGEGADIDETLGGLPELLRTEMHTNPGAYTVTAAYKVGRIEQTVTGVRPKKPCPMEEIWEKGPPELPDGLYAAFPGRATLAYLTAQKVLHRIFGDRAGPGTEAHPFDPAADGAMDNPSARTTGKFRMHWEYEDLDERRPVINV
jgi:hypothetical protein